MGHKNVIFCTILDLNIVFSIISCYTVLEVIRMSETQLLFYFKEPMITVTHTRDEEPGLFQMHTHTFAELYCFLSGKGTYHVEGSHYPLRPGDIMLMRPGEAHFIEVDPSVPYERICIIFNINLFAHLDPESKLLAPYFERAAGIYNHYPASSTASQLLKNLLREGGTLATITANLILLLQHLCVEFGQKPQLEKAKSSVEYQIIGHINRHLDEDLSINELCERYFLSRAQLCRRFKKATGTSIGKYITAKRLIQARQLILQGQKPTDVYTACGYGDYATFYRAYKSYFGHSPKRATAIAPTDDHNDIA